MHPAPRRRTRVDCNRCDNDWESCRCSRHPRRILQSPLFCRCRMLRSTRHYCTCPPRIRRCLSTQHICRYGTDQTRTGDFRYRRNLLHGDTNENIRRHCEDSHHRNFRGGLVCHFRNMVPETHFLLQRDRYPCPRLIHHCLPTLRCRSGLSCSPPTRFDSSLPVILRFRFDLPRCRPNRSDCSMPNSQSGNIR